MQQTEKLIKDYSDVEKGSYLGAIASIATADRTATGLFSRILRGF
jgi:hypothetical protein